MFSSDVNRATFYVCLSLVCSIAAGVLVVVVPWLSLGLFGSSAACWIMGTRVACRDRSS